MKYIHTASEQRLIWHAAGEKPLEQPPVAPVVLEGVRTPITGVDNPIKVRQLVDENYQDGLQRATAESLADVNKLVAHAQMLSDMVASHDHVLSPSAIQTSRKAWNEVYHKAGWHLDFANMRLSPYKPRDPKDIENARCVQKEQIKEYDRRLAGKLPPTAAGALRTKRRKAETILRRLDREETQLKVAAGQSQEVRTAPLHVLVDGESVYTGQEMKGNGQPQQPGVPMQGGNVAFAVPAGMSGLEHAKPTFDMKQWATEHPEIARSLKEFPPNVQAKLAQDLEYLHLEDQKALVSLYKKCKKFTNEKNLAGLLPIDPDTTPEDLRKKAKQSPLKTGKIALEALATFLEELTLQEKALLFHLARIPPHDTLDTVQNQPAVQSPEQLASTERKTIEKWMEKHREAKTDKAKNTAEGILRMMGVNVEESDFETKNIQMLPEGGMRLLAFVMGAIQVCSALFDRETVKDKKEAEKIKDKTGKNEESPKDESEKAKKIHETEQTISSLKGQEKGQMDKVNALKKDWEKADHSEEDGERPRLQKAIDDATEVLKTLEAARKTLEQKLVELKKLKAEEK